MRGNCSPSSHSSPDSLLPRKPERSKTNPAIPTSHRENQKQFEKRLKKPSFDELHWSPGTACVRTLTFWTLGHVDLLIGPYIILEKSQRPVFDLSMTNRRLFPHIPEPSTVTICQISTLKHKNKWIIWHFSYFLNTCISNYVVPKYVH